MNDSCKMLGLTSTLHIYAVLWCVAAVVFVVHFSFFKKQAKIFIPFFILLAFFGLCVPYVPHNVAVALLVCGGALLFLFVLFKFPKSVLAAVNMVGDYRTNRHEKFKAIAEFGTDMAFVLNKEFYITYASTFIKKWVGYDQFEIKDKGILCLFDGAQLNVFQEILELSKNNQGHPYELPEIKLTHKNGQTGYFELKVTYLPEEPGVDGWVIAFKNIQRRKEVQKNFQGHMSINDLLLKSSREILVESSEGIEEKIEAVLATLSAQIGLNGFALWQMVDPSVKPYTASEASGLPAGWKTLNGMKKQKWLYGRLEAFEDVVFDDLSELPKDAATLKKALQAEGCSSVCFMPIKGNEVVNASTLGGVLAFAAKEEYKWTPALLAQLSLFSKMIGVALHRRFSVEQLTILSQAVEQNPTSVVIFDLEGRVEFVNKQFELNTGYKASEVLNKDSGMFNADAGTSDTMKNIWKTLRTEEAWQGELLNRKKNGETFWEYVRVSPIKSPSGAIRYYLSTREDISLRKKYEKSLEQKSHYDILTGLPNRALGMDRLAEAIARKSEDALVAAMVVGLDTFKKVNDTFGHLAGDKLLLEAAKRIENAISHLDYSLARLGGDEFLVIVRNCSKDQAELAAGHVNKAFKAPFVFDEQEVSVTATLGVSLALEDGKDAKTLLQNADVAMHRAKDAGRDNFQFYTEEIHKEAMARVHMESLLRGAIEHNELQVFYQPILCGETGDIVGAEALLRWFSGKLGFVSPMDFIPLAENIGLIVPIGEWVLEQSCLQVKQWIKAGFGAKYVTVNVSARQFEQGNFVDTVKKVLKKTKVKPESIHLEVTESLLICDEYNVEKDLNELAELGVKISLDDFGTGYSSLSYLKRYHFDTLKIDRSFVRDIPDDEGDKALVEAIVLMAHSLKMDVVAEGVETGEQQDFLKSLTCDKLQGFYFSKPLPADEFSELARTWQKK